MSKVQKLESCKKNIKLTTPLVIIYLNVYFLVQLYKHQLYVLLKDPMYHVREFEINFTLWSNNGYVTFILYIIVWTVDIILQIFMITSILLISLICLCLSQEFKAVSIKLRDVMEFGRIYNSENFTVWRRKYNDLTDLVEDVNEKFKLYLFYIIVAYTLSILAVLYETTVCSTDNLDSVVWNLLPSIPLLSVVCSTVVVNHQVELIFF